MARRCGWRRPHHLTATLVLLIIASFVAGCATAEEPYTPFRNKEFCPPEDGNITAGSMLQANREALLHSLSTGAATTGFLNTSFGDPNDQVFGVIMCFADIPWDDCKKCLDRSPSYMVSTACPNRRTGAILYNECLLFYSTDKYFGSKYTREQQHSTAEPHDHVYVGDMVSMNNIRGKMMNRLIEQAIATPLRYGLDNDQSYKDPTTGVGVHGLVQCRRDLTTEECKRCLDEVVQDLLESFPNQTRASSRGFFCYAKYHHEPITLLMVPEPPPDGARPPPDPPCKMSLIVGLGVVAAASAIFFLLTLATLLCLFFGRWKERSAIANAGDQEMEGQFRNGAGPKGFSYGVLAAATGNFSDDQKLGEGGFGSVYKGFLDQLNIHVAIKRVSRSSSQGRKEYASEVTIISQLRHRNLVKLIGWCHSHDELLLVYDLMPNGSLDRYLYSPDNILSWQRRYDIILGIGSALLYLHQDCEQGVLHRDIKPSNVMLDAAFNAKLGDFGLARLVDHGRGAHTTELAGTMGYMDPDCMITGRFSTESDMYSFGVVLVEVACGRRPVVVLQEENAVVHLVQRVLEMHGRGEVLNAADPRLGGIFDERQMERVLEVGLWCTTHDRSLRPSIWQAVRALRFESSVPAMTNVHEPPPVIGRLTSVPSSSFMSEEDGMATRGMHAASLGPCPPTNYYTT